MKINEKSMKINEKSMENRYKKQMGGQQAQPTPEATPAHGHNPPFSNRFQTVFNPCFDFDFPQSVLHVWKPIKSLNSQGRPSILDVLHQQNR